MKRNLLKIAAIAIAISASAFTTNMSSLGDYEWVFTGSSTGEILDYTKYSKVDPEPSTCGLGNTLPCTVNFDDQQIADETALQSYLQDPNRTNQEVIDQSNALRN